MAKTALRRRMRPKGPAAFLRRWPKRRRPAAEWPAFSTSSSFATGNSARSALARSIHHGETSHSEPFQIRSLDGSSKSILISASPLRGLDGRIVGAVVLIQDLTESKTVIEHALERRVTNLISLGVELEESVAR